MEKLKLNDFFGYHFLSGLAYAPDGAHAAFVASVTDTDENKYQSDLYLLDSATGETRRLTHAGDARRFLWADARTLLFAAARDAKEKARTEKGEARTSFYALDIGGGEASLRFTIPMSVGKIRPLADGRYVMICEYDPALPNFDAMDAPAREAAYADIKKEKDYQVIDEIPFWHNGEGFTNRKRSRLYLYAPEGGALTAITDEITNVYDFTLSDDGRILFLGYAHVGKAGQTDFLKSYDLASGETQTLVEDGVYSIEYANLWDGEVVFFGSDGKKYGMGQYPALYALRGGEVVKLFEKDEGIGGNVGSDCRLGGGESVILRDGALYYTAARRQDTALVRVDKRGNEQVLIGSGGSVDAFDVYNGRILLIGMRGLRLQEIYALEGGSLSRLTDFNEAIFAEKTLSEPIPLEIESDGVAIEGFVIPPVDFDPTKRYPAILDIHGGPRTAYGGVFFHEMQLWANEGYFVIFCNPRGSEGRGDAFADIRGLYGTIDYDDLMRFTDAALGAHPAIDEKRLGVTGGSYGGYMTNWIIGHTNRFRAAASQRSIANWISKFNTTDIGYFFNADQIAATPWSNAEKLWWHSPVKYADKATTPTLFIHSDEDYRCWMAEGLQMFTALRYHGVETRLCLFHGENHELSRSGKPLHRERRLKEMTEWFDKYLKG